MKQIIRLIILLLLSTGINRIQAQEAITASGGNASGNNGSASYAAGQPTYIMLKGSTGSALQGVLQPYEIINTTGVINSPDTPFSLVTFPNPVSDYLILKINDFNNNEMSFQLYDLNGKLLKNKEIKKDLIRIEMKDLLPGIYYLSLRKNNIKVKTFEIIKQ